MKFYVTLWFVCIITCVCGACMDSVIDRIQLITTDKGLDHQSNLTKECVLSYIP